MTCFGAENETRTRDPNLGKVMLYQLSYFRILLPILVVWDCKGTHFFLTSKLFCKNFYIFSKKVHFSPLFGVRRAIFAIFMPVYQSYEHG